IKITYPIGWRGTEPIYFGALVGGVHLTDEEGHFNYVKAVRLTYNTREETVGNISYIWRKKVADFLSSKENPPSEILEFGLYHNESLPEGLQDVADALTPKFIMMSGILFAFTLGCSLVILRHENLLMGIDWVRSKPILGLAALVCPLLAVGSAFGLVLWTGEYYNAILTFGIGCFTTLPGVRLFCLYTFWGITFTYIYQITYFTAVIAYAGEMEDKGLHSLFGFWPCWKKCIRPELASKYF
uniref:SSD domain-containing protein n=1 Tax=Panagrolaimus sp. ES5 TaxID=591445 RepID=A0AC34G7H3_9BILA